MKIVQVCPLYYPYIGGVETHVREISERLAIRFDVEVLSTDPSGRLATEEIVGGVKVKRFKSLAPSESYYFSKELRRHLAKKIESSDILHAHSYRDLPALHCIQAKNVKKFVFTPHYHGAGTTFFRNLLHVPYRFFGKKIFGKADDIICVSNFEKNLVIDHFKIEEEKIKVVPNGVNSKEFEGLEKTRNGGKVILYVGRLEKYKGVHYLIKALPELDHDITFEIVGEGSYKNNLVKLATSLGVKKRIIFHQHLARKELLQKYVDADLFVSLSKYESYGISIAEALASKTPCIVANDSALREWVDNKNCFGISHPVHIDELGKLINEVIGTEIKEVRLWDWDNVIKELETIYGSPGFKTRRSDPSSRF